MSAAVETYRDDVEATYAVDFSRDREPIKARKRHPRIPPQGRCPHAGQRDALPPQQAVDLGQRAGCPNAQHAGLRRSGGLCRGQRGLDGAGRDDRHEDDRQPGQCTGYVFNGSR